MTCFSSSMKSLDLQDSLESFFLFDIILAGVAIFGLVVAAVAWSLGGWWLTVSAAMLVCEGILVYAIWYAPRRWRITELREPLVRDPSVWVKAVFISDLHAGTQARNGHFRDLVQSVNDLHPDLILHGGDFVTGHAQEAGYLESLGELKPVYGSYFILGNHDYTDNPQAVRTQLLSWGNIDITNSNLTLRIHGKELRLSGLDDTMLGLPAAMPERSADGVPHLTLTHSPDALFDMHEGQTDLMLCGHTHGGQIRLPFIGCLGVPTRLGCRADQGIRIINGVRTYISRGVGIVGCRARWLCRPEIVFLELGI